MLLSCTACVCVWGGGGGYAVLLSPVCVYTGLFHTFMHVLLERETVCVCVNYLVCIHVCWYIYACVCVWERERQCVCVCVHYLVLRRGHRSSLLNVVPIVLQCINSTNAC